MKDADEDLVRISETISDGGDVDWAEERRRRPDVEPLILELEAIERVVRSYGLLHSASGRLHAPPPAERPPRP